MTRRGRKRGMEVRRGGVEDRYSLGLYLHHQPLSPCKGNQSHLGVGGGGWGDVCMSMMTTKSHQQRGGAMEGRTRGAEE